MLEKSILKFSAFTILCIGNFFSFGQNKAVFTDGRNGNYCTSCQGIINQKPKEVSFGIQINSNGEIYFSMSDKNWFSKIFKNNSYGVTVDIISKERYNCSKESPENLGIPKGTTLPGTYKEELLENNSELIKEGTFTKIGNVPSSLLGKEIEGDLVILNGPYICYYTNFVNIERSIWQLLPMGFFTDSLLNEYKSPNTHEKDFFTYSRKITIEIPFSKGSSSFDYSYLKKYYDSIHLSASTIKKIEIRAYSSIEGSENINKALMAKRAESMISALKTYQPSIKRINVITAENWLDFFKDIKTTQFDDFNSQSKFEIKKKLTDSKTLLEIEPILSHHRKVIAILYLENKSQVSSDNDSSILNQFRKAISTKEISKAQMILKEISDRIIDKKLPLDFINKIEVPNSKEYSPLLNDREVYKYLLKTTDEYEAFENLMEIRKLDSTNGRLNYNICALRFFLWQFGNDSISRNVLFKEINRLSNQGITDVLIKRMKINYYILKSEDQMKIFDYRGKDSSLNEIRKIYEKIEATDEDIYSLAKYYSFYSHMDWSQEIIEPRIRSINVSEDLLFYYLNLLFFQPGKYHSDEFKKATLNAVNLNTKRFCTFFRPNNKGGASMQLLEYDEMKKVYCSECTHK